MATIYGDTNAKVSHNRLKWNIKATTTIPDSNTPGQIGDVLVITSANIKKLKFVATKSLGDELQDNSINVYKDFTASKVLVNQNNGFDMYMFGTAQNILLNGENVIANVYFYDGLTNQWVQYTSAYVDAINLNSFTGQNINVDDLWTMSYTDELNEENILPTIHRVNVSDTFNINTFVGVALDVDSLWNSITITEGATVNNLTKQNETNI